MKALLVGSKSINFGTLKEVISGAVIFPEQDISIEVYAEYAEMVTNIIHKALVPESLINEKGWQNFGEIEIPDDSALAKVVHVLSAIQELIVNPLQREITGLAPQCCALFKKTENVMPC